MSEKQSKTNIPSWVTLVINFIMGLFNNNPVEKAKADVIEAEALVETTKAEVQAKKLKEDAKRQKKIADRIAKAKTAIPVKKLKKGKSILIKIGDKYEKKIFLKYDEEHVYTNDGGKFKYGQVFNWHKRTVLKPEVVETT